MSQKEFNISSGSRSNQSPFYLLFLLFSNLNLFKLSLNFPPTVFTLILCVEFQVWAQKEFSSTSMCFSGESISKVGFADSGRGQRRRADEDESFWGIPEIMHAG